MSIKGYLNTGQRNKCFGCEACVQICPVDALRMMEDNEGFRYPCLDKNICIKCGKCHLVCPYENAPVKYEKKKMTFGGYHTDLKIRCSSTSGGAFSAIAGTWCDENYVIFGAVAEGINVYHSYIIDKSNIDIFRKSKYSQSVIGNTFRTVKKFLSEGKKVLFSGTPCQNAGLIKYLGECNKEKLLTIEVICEGVPSPLFIRKYEMWLVQEYGAGIKSLDYRYKYFSELENPISGKWDFEVMYTLLQNGKEFKKDRWWNPFWSIWLNHLMSRPSCYECPFAESARVSDITLGDLWGVHIYCPELYGNNNGASLIICNTEKGKNALKKARSQLYGHELDFDIALKYQSPMRKPIAYNAKRVNFMQDLQNLDVGYEEICNKWSVKPSLKLLFQKYVWGNKQKVCFWRLKNKLFK
jgi:coenzyme F420-reducing hydrogenase beta subunit